ncbi:hypothetical protein D3C78_1634600 [compost metagenome]
MADAHAFVVLSHDARRGGETTIVARRIHLSPRQACHPVLQHAPALGLHGAKGIAGFIILARDHPVQAVLGEEVGPGVQIDVVEHAVIGVVQVADFVAGDDHGLAHRPITLRQ